MHPFLEATHSFEATLPTQPTLQTHNWLSMQQSTVQTNNEYSTNNNSSWSCAALQQQEMPQQHKATQFRLAPLSPPPSCCSSRKG